MARVFCTGLLALTLAAVVVSTTGARSRQGDEASGFVTLGATRAFILGITARLNPDGTCTVVSVSGNSPETETTTPCPDER